MWRPAWATFGRQRRRAAGADLRGRDGDGRAEHDDLGSYSGFESASTGGGGGGEPTDERTYLRGAQATNQDGIAEFRTIFPDWYRGRTCTATRRSTSTGRPVLTSQLFFAEDVTETVYAREPYRSRTSRDPSTTATGSSTSSSS